jgi:hypothetical protein
VEDLRTLSESDSEYPPILFFYQGTPEDGEAFFRRHWAGARAVADAPKRFYIGFGLERGSFNQILGPEVMACGLRAARKGHVVGIPHGDIWMMPGLFLVSGERVVWEYLPRHAGDHPDFTRIPALAREAKES